MMEFCDRDTAVGLWKTGNNNINEIIVVSFYMDILLPGVWPAAFGSSVEESSFSPQCFCFKYKLQIYWESFLASKLILK